MIVFDLPYMKLLHNDYTIFVQLFVWYGAIFMCL